MTTSTTTSNNKNNKRTKQIQQNQVIDSAATTTAPPQLESKVLAQYIWPLSYGMWRCTYGTTVPVGYCGDILENSQMPPVEVYPGLFLGSYYQGREFDILRKLNIRYIINAGEKNRDIAIPEDFKCMIIDIRDSAYIGNNILAHDILKPVMGWIEMARR
jgi:hypothetical protein